MSDKMSDKTLFKPAYGYIKMKGWEFLGYLVAEDSELIVYHDGQRYNVSLVVEGWDEPILMRDDVERMLMACRDILHDNDHGSGMVVFSIIMLDIDGNHAMVKHGFQAGDEID